VSKPVGEFNSSLRVIAHGVSFLLGVFFLGSACVKLYDIQQTTALNTLAELSFASLQFILVVIGFNRRCPDRLFNILAITVPAIFVCYNVYEQLFLVPFSTDYRIQLDSMVLWILLVIISAYLLLGPKTALVLSLIYSTVLTVIVGSYLSKHGLLVAGNSGYQSWIRHFVFGLPLLTTFLQLFALLKNQLHLAKERELLRSNDAFTDSLTRINNRRCVELLLKQELAKKQRFPSHTICLILLDVDHFKTVNDCHGHRTGDRVLVSVTKAIVSSLRSSDWAGRWGGEEFLIGISGSLKEALVAAERFRSRIESIRIPKQPAVTASFGVAEAQPDDTIDSLLERADQALYLAKGEGRNCVRAEADDNIAQNPTH